MAGKIGVLDNEEVEVAVRPAAAMCVGAEEHDPLWIAGTANSSDDLVQQPRVYRWERWRSSHWSLS